MARRVWRYGIGAGLAATLVALAPLAYPHVELAPLLHPVANKLRAMMLTIPTVFIEGRLYSISCGRGAWQWSARFFPAEGAVDDRALEFGHFWRLLNALKRSYVSIVTTRSRLGPAHGNVSLKHLVFCRRGLLTARFWIGARSR